jgi:hypothetical protein
MDVSFTVSGQSRAGEGDTVGAECRPMKRSTCKTNSLIHTISQLLVLDSPTLECLTMQLFVSNRAAQVIRVEQSSYGYRLYHWDIDCALSRATLTEKHTIDLIYCRRLAMPSRCPT